MDAKSIEELLKSGKSECGQNTLRLIVTMYELVEDLPPLVARKFASRLEYRQALIARQREKVVPVNAEVLADRFRSIGLTAQPGPLSHSVVIEGSPDLLSEALADAAVESAVLDEKIELIRPLQSEE